MVKSIQVVLLVQPSSVASERVFSILTNSFSTQQESSLEDYVQLSSTTIAVNFVSLLLLIII